MPKKRRQGKIPTPAWEHSRGAIGSRVLGRGFQFYGAVLVAVLLGVGVGVVVFAFWADWQEERGRPGSTAIQVEDTRYRLDYFSRRLKMFVDQNGGQGAVEPVPAINAVSDLLIREDIIHRFAGEMEVSASEEEILEEIASRLGIPADDDSFEVVFQQELARSGLSEEDYRLMIEAAVLAAKLTEKFLEEVPETAESVHYRQILVSTDERAQELKAEIEEGGDFAALAAEHSLDAETREAGGDVGWIPRGFLAPSMEELVFALEPGEVTTVPGSQGVLVLEMIEKDDARAVDDDRKRALAELALNEWVSEKRAALAIVNNMDLGVGDQDKILWARDQVFQN